MRRAARGVRAPLATRLPGPQRGCRVGGPALGCLGGVQRTPHPNMDQGGVGRLLVASLHQGISDLLPTRLEFYENWLRPAGLRDGSIGLAPLAAVLSFLRQEGEPYRLVTSRAGEYAAEWTFHALSGLERGALRALPRGLRARMALRLARRVVRNSYKDSRATVRLRRGEGSVDVRGSIFCGVREPVRQPLCTYYASAVGRLLALCEIEGSAHMAQCRGTGASTCRVAVLINSDM